MPYDLVSPFAPAGDQPRAIRELAAGLARDDRYQTLLGVTGSGKTMTMAHVIAGFGRPTLVLSHNKTLAAQLYGELKAFFPKSAVEFFISYYDYYQPEAYVPQTDTYIAKDSSINDDIDRLRLRATSSLMEREDVVIVASVSAIYGLGDPELYRQRLVTASVGEARGRDALLEALVGVQYQRNDTAFERGTFRVRGDTIEVFPAYDEQAVRVEFWGDTVERIAKIDPLTGNTITELARAAVYPATHFVTERPTIERAVAAIRAELKERLAELRVQNKLLEAQRLESRTHFDIDMLLEVGRCTGIENYSRPLTGRAPGERPACLLDYFPDDYLCIIDESHQTLPQLAGMYEGDRSRKQTLVDYGFRLPSALDNRPLRIDECKSLVPRILFVSATPGEEELRLSGGAQPPGGVATGEPRPGPGGVPPPPPLPRPDRGPRGAPPQRQRHPLRRPADGLDAAGARRDEPAAPAATGIQRTARHHAPLDREVGGPGALCHTRGGREDREGGGRRRPPARGRARARRADPAAGAADAGGGRGARFRAGGVVAGPDPRASGGSGWGAPCACTRTNSTGSVRTSAASSPRPPWSGCRASLAAARPRWSRQSAAAWARACTP